MEKNTVDIPNEIDIRKEFGKLTEYLIKNNISITTMESVTSGMIASLITDTEGASAIFKGALVTYSNEAKIRYGVPKETIDKFSVYSVETAEAMARACAREFSADIGIGVTGTTGNIDPANPDSSIPGQVFFAISYKGTLHSYKKDIEDQPSRLDYKLAVADEIYKSLADLLK